MVTMVNKGPNTQYGDLLLDEECLFVRRGENKIHFTRNERAVLLALTRNPTRLMTRSRLLDEIAADEDRSDRYIDFLINRLRSKLRDDPRSPTFIATRYGEGYIWTATPTAAPQVDALLVILTKSIPDGHPLGRTVSALVERLHRAIRAGVDPDQAIVAGEDWRTGAEDRARYLLHLDLHASGDALDCVATLREMPSRRIVLSLPLDLAAMQAAW